MNILFYKLLARNELLEQAKHILNARDFEYTLENQIRACGYNPIEKLKELEDDIDSQVLTPEIRDYIIGNVVLKDSDIFTYIKELYNLIDLRFKTYGIYIIKELENYLLDKKIDFFNVDLQLNDDINKYTSKYTVTNKETLSNL